MRKLFVLLLLSTFYTSALYAFPKKVKSCKRFLNPDLSPIFNREAESALFRALSARRLAGIESERLMLRPLESGDQGALDALIYAGASGYFLENSPEKNADRVSFIRSWALSADISSKSTTFAIYDKRTQKLAGMVDLSSTATPQEFSLGYIVAPEFRDRGYAIEAVSALLNEVRPLATPGMSIKSRAKVDNPASWHVLEKVGFEHEATDTYTIDGTVLHRYRLSF